MKMDLFGDNVVTSFLEEEYFITPSRGCLEQLVDAGFRVLGSKNDQLTNLNAVQNELNFAGGRDGLTARVFA
ncbi:hypothetical protein ACFLYT_00950, partial [Nanoarchaeota archaeon]